MLPGRGTATLLVAALLSCLATTEARAEGQGVIAGVAFDRDGLPVVGARVEARVHPMHDHRWSHASVGRRFKGHKEPEHAARTQTDHEGRWRLEGLSLEVTYLLEIAGPHDRTAAFTWSHAFAIKGPEVRAQLRETVTLRARLVDHDGAALRGFVTVGVTEPGTPRGLGTHQIPQWFLQTATDAQGDFLIRAPPGASLAIQAEATGVGERSGVRATMPDAAATPTKDSLHVVVRTPQGGAVTGVVRDTDGKPVPGARVVAQASTGGRFEALDPCAGYAVTDAEGRYRIEHLPGRALTGLVVAKEGFVLLLLPGRARGVRNGTPLPPGKGLAVDLVLTRGRSLRGRVLDEGGKPLVGAKVRFDIGGGMYWRALPTGTTTDGSGQFALDHLPFAAGFVVAETPTHVPASAWTKGAAPGHRIRADAPAVVAGIELKLALGETLEGRVVDRAGKAIPEAVVRLHYTHPAGSNAGFRNLPAATDAQGRFAFHGLPPIEYPAVVVDAPGFAKHEARLSASGATVPVIVLPKSGRISGRILNAKGEPLPGTPVRRPQSGDVANADAEGRFTLDRLPPGRHQLIIAGPGSTVGRATRVVELTEGGHVEGVEFRLDEDTVPRGTAVIAGVVLDDDDHPVGGEPVSVDSVQLRGFSASTRSGADGSFRIEHLPAGSYWLRGGTPQRRYPIVEAGTTNARIRARSQHVHVLAGVVRNPEGERVPYGTVQVGYVGDGPYVDRHAVALFDGRFRVAIPADVHAVTVQVVDPRDVYGRPLSLIDVYRPHVRMDARPLEIILKPAAEIRGVVRDAAGGSVAGLVLRATRLPQGHPGPQSPVAETDASGLFVFPGLQPRDYRVQIDDNATWQAPPPRTVTAPQDALVLLVRRFGGLAGRVLDADGAPLFGIRVYATAKPRVAGQALPALNRGGGLTDCMTDAQGRFALRRLSPAVLYTLRMSLPTHLAVDHFAPELERIEAGRDDLELRLTRGATIRGQVVDPEGKPVAKILVRTSGPMGDDGRRDPLLSRKAMTDGDGRFRIGPLTADAAVEIFVAPTPRQRHEGLPWLPKRVEGLSADAEDVRIALERGVEIAGRVEGATPAELRHLRLTLKPQGERTEYSYTFDGRTTTYAFAGLAPGLYVLRAGSTREVQLRPVPEIQAPASDVVLHRLIRVRLTGRLTGVDPKGFSAAFFRLDQRAGRRPRTVPLGKDGTFDLGSVTNDPGILMITHAAGTHIVCMDLTPSEAGVAAKAVKTKRIKGRILDLPGKLRRARIIARRGPITVPGTIAEDGLFEIGGLAPGPWDLEITAPDPSGGSFEIPKKVKAGALNVFVKWRPK